MAPFWSMAKTWGVVLRSLCAPRNVLASFGARVSSAILVGGTWGQDLAMASFSDDPESEQVLQKIKSFFDSVVGSLNSCIASVLR